MSTAPAPSTTDFDGLVIGWDERVLRPRPWTLAQPRWLAELSARAPDGAAVELFCGAGHMGLVLARDTGRRAVLVDVDPVACEHARANADRAGLDVTVRCASIDAAVGDDERFALALVDPPWVRSDGVDALPDDPALAIDGGDDGLDLAREAVAVLVDLLVPGGHAVLQLGEPSQADVLWRSVGGAAERFELVEVRDHRPGGALVHLRARS